MNSFRIIELLGLLKQVRIMNIGLLRVRFIKIFKLLIIRRCPTRVVEIIGNLGVFEGISA